MWLFDSSRVTTRFYLLGDILKVKNNENNKKGKAWMDEGKGKGKVRGWGLLQHYSRSGLLYS
jgi:hypothetical protein